MLFLTIIIVMDVKTCILSALHIFQVIRLTVKGETQDISTYNDEGIKEFD